MAGHDSILREMQALAGVMYEVLHTIEVELPEEKWATVSKLRSATNDSLFYAALATGSAIPGAGEYEWNNARKNVVAMRVMYIFAGKQSFTATDPDIVLRLDRLVKDIDVEIKATRDAAQSRESESLKPWMEKYRIWREIHET